VSDVSHDAQYDVISCLLSAEIDFDCMWLRSSIKLTASEKVRPWLHVK